MKITAPPDSPNTDGINIEQGVQNLVKGSQILPPDKAYNLQISNGDDGFAVNVFRATTLVHMFY